MADALDGVLVAQIAPHVVVHVWRGAWWVDSRVIPLKCEYLLLTNNLYGRKNIFEESLEDGIQKKH